MADSTERAIEAKQAVEDLRLLAQWQAGDNAAGEVLVRYYGPRLLRFFSSKRIVGAEDLVQLTLMACVTTHRHYRGNGSFAAFLFGIARNELLHYFRGLGRHGHVDFKNSSIADLQGSACERVAAAQDERMLLEALRTLSVDEQILIELYYWEEMTARELSTVLSVPEGTIRTRLMSAKKRLQRAIATFSSDGAAHLKTTRTRLGDWAQSLTKRRD